MRKDKLFTDKTDTINDKGMYVYDPKDSRHTKAVSKCDIFKEPLRFKKTNDSITFYGIGIDYVGTTLKASQKKEGGAYTIPANKFDLQPGYYPLDEEESNEDQAVFLLNLNQQ